MKKKLLLLTLLVIALACIFVISASAEAVYVNANGEQVSADSDDIAYELEISDPWNTTGNSRIKYIYLYDTSITKIVIPAYELTHSNGTVYKAAEYSYVRLSTGWGATLAVHAVADRETKATSLHTQITELEFHVPVLLDGANSSGNLAGWSSLEKLSFYNRAYEPQSKGGSLSGCSSLKELHFYGQNNQLSGNFFVSSMTKVVFHEGATGTIRTCAMQSLNGTGVQTVVYMNTTMTPLDSTDPRLTWNRNTAGLSFVYLVPKTIGVYTDEQIESYAMTWTGGNNKSDSNSAWTASIMTFCDFYEEHTVADDDHDCTTGLTCSKCLVTEAGKTHSVSIDWTYSNGYSAVGTKIVTCVNEAGCKLAQEGIETPGTYETPALITALGYSTKENGSGGLTAGFTVNNPLVEEFFDYKGVEIEIGLFVARASSFGDTIFDANGDMTAKGIKLDMSDFKYSNLKISVEGFTKEYAQSIDLAMAVYVKESAEVQASYSYIQGSYNPSYYDTVTVGDGEGAVVLEKVTLYNVAKATGLEALILSDGTLTIE